MENKVEYVKNCNSPKCTGDCKAQIYMPCEVCSLVHGDTSVKHVFYCDVCQAYICCKKCRTDFVNRGIAAAMKAANKVKEFVTSKPNNEKAKTFNRRNK